MNRQLKNILHKYGVYHPLQLGFRNILFWTKRNYCRITYAAFKGSGLSCNVCGHQYSKFIDDEPDATNRKALEKHQVIAGYGKQILCPYCLSNARERLVLTMLEHHHDISGKKILQLAPEKNIHRFLKKKATVVTADLFPGYYKSIDAHIIQEDATAFSFANESFDAVIANHVMEHIPDDKKAMKEIFRVLKHGGFAVLQVPYSMILDNTIEDSAIDNPQLQSALYGQRDHVRIYQLRDYVARLESAGFIVKQFHHEQLKHLDQYAIQQGEVFLDIRKPV